VAALFTAYAIEGIPPIEWARLLLDQVRTSTHISLARTYVGT
jgi:hypothetical protein